LFESRRKANAAGKKARVTAVVLLVLALFFFFLGVEISQYSPFIVSSVLLLIAILAFLSGGGTWAIGAVGEETIAAHLNALGLPYRVIHDVVLPSMRGNIDHVVLGPNGVFVIETKNHNGFITCNGDSWTQRKVGQLGTPYLGKIGCPSKQVKRYAITLRDFIRNKMNRDVYVNGVVVFTNREVALRINNPTVGVLRPDRLCQFIKTYSSKEILQDNELRALESAIQPYSRFY
jgi:hypothetical protein